VLGAIFVVIALSSDLVWALVAGSAAEMLKHSRAFLRAQRYVSGTVFIGLGALAAVTRRDGV
jgi:threonine/homoserine/homoserine lactone efflux protein